MTGISSRVIYLRRSSNASPLHLGANSSSDASPRMRSRSDITTFHGVANPRRLLVHRESIAKKLTRESRRKAIRFGSMREGVSPGMARWLRLP
jgi:hypothetical protein